LKLLHKEFLSAWNKCPIRGAETEGKLKAKINYQKTDMYFLHCRIDSFLLYIYS
jgi:hypothetical protein